MARSKSESGTVLHAWDHYVKEADKPPFELRVSDEETVTITCPTGAQMHRIAEGQRSGDPDIILMGLCGDAYDRIMELLSAAPHEATDALVGDLLDHFGFTADVTLEAPSGQRQKVSNPRDIARLLLEGWRPAPDDIFPTSGPNGS